MGLFTFILLFLFNWFVLFSGKYKYLRKLINVKLSKSKKDTIDKNN